MVSYSRDERLIFLANRAMELWREHNVMLILAEMLRLVNGEVPEDEIVES